MDKGGRFKTPGTKENVVCAFQRIKESVSQRVKIISSCKHYPLNISKVSSYLGIGHFHQFCLVFWRAWVVLSQGKSVELGQESEGIVGEFLTVAH